MASSKTGDAVLVSIRPIYVDAILSGEKRVEFRKVRFRRDVKKLLIYATAPISAIVAIVDIAGFIEDSPANVWKQCASKGAVDSVTFWNYFANCDHAVGIQLADVTRLQGNLSLNALFPGAKAPQSFCYVPCEAAERALSLAES